MSVNVPPRSIQNCMRDINHPVPGHGMITVAACNARAPLESETSMKRLAAALVIALTFALPALAQTKWDHAHRLPGEQLPHREPAAVRQPTSTRRPAASSRSSAPNASLFKAPEIKRAVQGGQAQAGEILLVNFENEDPLYGIDGVPFLATSYAEAMKLYKARTQGARRQAREAGHDAALHGAVAAAGHLSPTAR